MKIVIDELMTSSGVQFGTSGVRGLVTEMTDQVCWLYVTAFLQYLKKDNIIQPGDNVGIAGDLRNSSERIMLIVANAVLDFGLVPVNYGFIPSPAIALYGLHKNMATLMVTGSHIPDDRNGIKFNTPKGEILKEDELAIRKQSLIIPDGKFTESGDLAQTYELSLVCAEASEHYTHRFIDFFDKNCLQGIRVGVYEHSSVSRDFLNTILSSLGATVTSLGRSDKFISVDTEAVRPEDVVLAKQWAKLNAFDCIVSTDGDGDRPLISDEYGNWMRGDIVGILCAHYLKANVVVTPVSSNTVVEKSEFFEQVMRTRIGSPYVIAAMEKSEQSLRVVGYEANGGFLQASSIENNGKYLSPLPTRDAVIVIITILLLTHEKKLTISELIKKLPQRFTFSDRLKDFPTRLSQHRLTDMISGSQDENFQAIKKQFSFAGDPVLIDTTDGVRIEFDNDDIIHIRPSGNAPELRCYTESSTEQRAVSLNKLCIYALVQWKKDSVNSKPLLIS